MKPTRPFESHLIIKESTLPPGKEWLVQSSGWSFLRMTQGASYWLHPRMNFDLAAGSLLIVSEQARGLVRASQLAPATIHYFTIRPERLTGLVTLEEQHCLQRAANEDRMTARLFGPSTPPAQRFKDLCENSKSRQGLAQRLDLLALFVDSFAEQLASRPAASCANDAKARLVKLLNDTPPSNLLDLSFADLVCETRCTPRHLSRIFHQVVGMSFREKQAQVRLLRAQELLATTESKVVEVAFESGYQSLSLFNLMFKRRFGTTPARWRDQTKNDPAIRRSAGRAALLRT